MVVSMMSMMRVVVGVTMVFFLINRTEGNERGGPDG